MGMPIIFGLSALMVVPAIAATIALPAIHLRGGQQARLLRVGIRDRSLGSGGGKRPDGGAAVGAHVELALEALPAVKGDGVCGGRLVGHEGLYLSWDIHSLGRAAFVCVRQGVNQSEKAVKCVAPLSVGSVTIDQLGPGEFLRP